MESDEDMSFKQRVSKELNTHRQTVRKRGRPEILPNRVVVLCLGLLDALLLIAALVLGIYCAKASDFQHASDSALAPLIIERNLLRNQSDVTKERLDAQVALDKQRKANVELQVQVRQQETITDSLQRYIESLRVEKAQLELNRTTLENSCSRCPLGWILLKTSCYYYSVPLSNDKKNWSESRADCISRGGDLIVINNLAEQHLLVGEIYSIRQQDGTGQTVIDDWVSSQTVLQKLINNNYPRIPGTGAWWSMGFWIGLTDTVMNGVWVWVNNVTENSTMYWKEEQPSTDPALDGHCAAFGRNVVSWKSWYNRNCKNDLLHWICEMEPR